MIAHFFKRCHSIFGFAKRHLVSGDHPMIKGYPVMMEHKIIAIDHKVQLVGNPKHFDFTFPCRGIIWKILVQYKITNSKTEGVSQLINFILNIKFGLPVTNSARKSRFATVFHRCQTIYPLFCFFRLFDFSIQCDKSIDSIVSCILIVTFVGYRSKQRFDLLEKRLVVRFLPYKIQAHRKIIPNLIIVRIMCKSISCVSYSLFNRTNFCKALHLLLNVGELLFSFRQFISEKFICAYRKEIGKDGQKLNIGIAAFRLPA